MRFLNFIFLFFQRIYNFSWKKSIFWGVNFLWVNQKSLIYVSGSQIACKGSEIRFSNTRAFNFRLILDEKTGLGNI